MKRIRLWLRRIWCQPRGHWMGRGTLAPGSVWYKIGVEATCRRCGLMVVGDVVPAETVLSVTNDSVTLP